MSVPSESRSRWSKLLRRLFRRSPLDQPPPLPSAQVATGPMARADLETFPAFERALWRDYQPEREALETIRAHAQDLRVLIFLGIWCGDTRRQVPRFLRIADLAGMGEDALELVGLDRQLQDPDGLAARWQVRQVPTLIFLRDGRELGRVVESPRNSLEADIAALVASE